ncbi:MAG: tRNA (guanosine(46)-N7)-methyltransferase TrmB, partial [Pseudomonadota bacterium]
MLRQGRITSAQTRAFFDLWPRFGLAIEHLKQGPIDLSQAFFGRAGPVFLEIGFGNGDTLLALAARYPERNFLGIEVHRPGVGHLLLELERQGLNNVRVIQEDAVRVLDWGLPPSCVAGVYLFFPDPWHKARHHKRRLVTPAFAESLSRVMVDGGTLWLATDWQDYAQQMREVFAVAP